MPISTGLIIGGAIGSALSSGVDEYRAERKFQEDQKQRKFQRLLEGYKAGLMPSTNVDQTQNATSNPVADLNQNTSDIGSAPGLMPPPIDSDQIAKRSLKSVDKSQDQGQNGTGMPAQVQPQAQPGMVPPAQPPQPTQQLPRYPASGIDQSLDKSYAPEGFEETPMAKMARNAKLVGYQKTVDASNANSQYSKEHQQMARDALNIAKPGMGDRLIKPTMSAEEIDKNPLVLAAMKGGFADERQANKPDATKMNPVDRIFAKDYAEYVPAGGYAAAMDGIDQLKKIRDDLLSGKVSTGGVGGYGPDWVRSITSPGGLETEQALQKVVLKDLKHIFPGRVAVDQMNIFLKKSYDPRLSNEANVRKLDSAIEDAQKMADAKQRAAEYFEKNGTLSGFKGAQYVTGEQGSGTGLMKGKAGANPLYQQYLQNQGQ